MSVNDDYVVNIRIATSIMYASNGKINIVVRRPYAYLAKDIAGVFTGQKDVCVRVDRRFSDRRKENLQYSGDRREEERRQIKEALVDVVISDPGPED